MKIHGFRIELGEIEAALTQHPAVRESVVTVREEGSGDKRLVGYVVLNQDQTASVDQLRSSLKQKLPHYMIPSAVVFLDTLPLTPNGKIDRRALPAPDFEQSLSSDFVAPRTPTEALLANIFAEVLQVEKVGIHDNFFELGGHSLLATQVIARVSAASCVDLPLRDLFEGPTIAELAEMMIFKEIEQADSDLLGQILTDVDE